MNPVIALLVGALISHAIVRKNGDNSLGWWRPAALPLRWSAAGYSPHLVALDRTGEGKPEHVDD